MKTRRSFSLPALLPCLYATALSCAFVRTAAAQIADWSTFPAGSSTQIEQSLVVVPNGNAVSVFSAITKSWATVVGLTGVPGRTVLNEHLLVRDGALFYGYSPRTGSFQAIYTSPTAYVAPNLTPQTFYSAVVDGNRLHVFFAFTGQWQSYTFATAPTITTGRFCALVTDGSTTWGISSYFGTLVQAPAGATPVRADGNMAFASDPNTLFGFSAATNAWQSLAVTGTPSITIGNNQPTVAAIQDAVTISLFSGHRGTFVTLPAASSSTVLLERELALVVDGSTVHAYSGLTGTAAVLQAAASPTVTMQQMFALIDDGTGVTAYSATTGTFAAPEVLPSAALQTSAQIAVAAIAGVPIAAYSSMRNRWDPVPMIAGASSYQNAVALVLVDPAGGVWGWSQRGAGWIHEPSAPIDTVVVGSCPPGTPETIFLRSGNTLLTFNPRTEAWRSVTTMQPATLVRAHYQAILAQDGSNAYAFSIWNDRWSVEPLATGYVGGTAQVQAAYVNDGTWIHAYGGFGQLSLLGEYPDFYRAATSGMPLRQDITGEPGSLVLLAASIGAADINLPFGTLRIDPTAMVQLMLASLPNSGVMSYTFPVPDVLPGTEWFFQAAIFGPSGLYLTNSVFPLFP